MSAAECATESNALAMDSQPSKAQPDPAEKARKRLFVSFGGTVVFGLALAGWYVGDRIYAAEVAPSDPVSFAAIEQSVKFPLPVPPPAALEIPVPPPKPPELYLQTASLGGKQDSRFLKQLELKGYTARIDDSGAQEGSWILIGPYADQASLARAKRKLGVAGILASESSR